MDRGVQKVHVDEKWTHDQTGKVIECVEERAESDIERVETASGSAGRKQEENEREELEELFISHFP
jgi:hypothetical protein